MERLIEYNNNKLQDILNGLRHDGLVTFDYNPFAETFHEATQILSNMKGKSFVEISKLHNDLQNLLWKELQCNPNYNRSVSFIFIKQIVNTPMTDKELAKNAIYLS